MQLQLNPRLDRRLICEVFRRQGRVHIPDVFALASANALYSILSTQTPWQVSLNVRQRHLDLAHEQLMLMPPDKRELMTRAMQEQARHGFQYVFENFPIFDLYRAGRRDHPLLELQQFFDSAEFLDFAREITGIEQIAFADSQATRYLPGHFLTEHDDNVAGKQRLAAYVLGLTPQWRADWGGILQFIADDGHIAEGYVPKFNTLNLFRVPQKHSVSYVAPARRLNRATASLAGYAAAPIELAGIAARQLVSEQDAGGRLQILIRDSGDMRARERLALRVQSARNA